MPAFVGRAREIASLREALDGGPTLVFIEAEAGFGKTRLLKEALADQDGGVALVASCPPFRQPQTLGPVVDAVRNATSQIGELELSALGGALRPLLPEWAAQLPPALEPAEDATAARHRVFRALLELLARLGVTVLAVEDAHWADDATLEFLLFLTSGTPSGLSLVITCRPEEVAPDSLLWRLSSRRSSQVEQVRITLVPLTEAETAELVSSMLDGEPVTAEFARFMRERTDGVPLAIEEFMRLMVDRDDVVLLDGELMRRRLSEIAVPATIRDAVLERMRRLSRPAQEAVRAMAVLGAPAPTQVVLDVCGLEQTQAQLGLDEAMGCGLLADDVRGRIAFRHVLPSQVIYEATSAATRLVMHRRAGQALTSSSPASQLARHFRSAGDTIQWARYAEQAADLAIAAGDCAAADQLLHDLIVNAGLPGTSRAKLASKITFAVFPGEAVLQELATALRAPLNEEAMSRAEEGAIRFQVARAVEVGDDQNAARADLELAADYLPAGSPEATMAMIRLGWPHGSLCSAAENLRWLQRAAAVPLPQDEVLRMLLLVDRVTALLSLGEDSGWTEAATILEGPDPGRAAFHVVRGILNTADEAIRWGRLADARRRLDRGMRLAEQHGYQRLFGPALVTRAHLDWFTGAWDGLAERAGRFTRRTDLSPGARAEATMIIGMLHVAEGAVDKARTCLTQALAENIRRGSPEFCTEPAAALARVSLADGDAEEALRLTSEQIAVVTRRGIWNWATDVAPIRVQALLATGRGDEAAELVAAMTDGLRDTSAPAAHASLLLCRAIVAEARAEPKAAAAYALAAAAWQALPRPYDALLARERQARSLLAAGERESGIRLLTATAKQLGTLGATADAGRVIRLLRDHGVAVRRPGPGRPSHGGVLTPREREVVELLATGRTDKEIAERLFLSPKTVATHMDSARRKLKVASRTALVMAALEAGLIEALP